MYFCVVVEINKNIAGRVGLAIVDLMCAIEHGVTGLLAFPPMFDPPRPPIERAVVVTADIKFFRTMEPDVNGICGQIFRIWEFSGGVGDDESNVSLPQ